MEDLRQQQIDVLLEAVPYSEKLSEVMDKISGELIDGSAGDVKDTVDAIVEGLNWVFEVYNGTKGLINPKKDKVNEAKANDAVKSLSNALKTNADAQLGQALKEVGTFVKEFHDAAVPYVAY